MSQTELGHTFIKKKKSCRSIFLIFIPSEAQHPLAPPRFSKQTQTSGRNGQVGVCWHEGGLKLLCFRLSWLSLCDLYTHITSPCLRSALLVSCRTSDFVLKKKKRSKQDKTTLSPVKSDEKCIHQIHVSNSLFLHIIFNSNLYLQSASQCCIHPKGALFSFKFSVFSDT